MTRIEMFSRVGANIKEVRKQRGLTQEQFAQICNISYGTVRNLESKNASTTISLYTLYQISKQLDIPLSFLLKGIE